MNLLNVFIWKEEEVFERVTEILKEPPTFTDGANYAFWNRKSPICVQAHIDVAESKNYSVWNEIKNKFVKEPVSKDAEVELVKYKNIISRKNGILGGDDRAGILAILIIHALCKTGTKSIAFPSVLLTNGEESGGTGMKEFLSDLDKDIDRLLEPIRLILALDRKGLGEYVHYTDPGKEVKEYIESFGFNHSYGSWSDSKKITEKWKIPHINLSVGYYDNHSEKETVHLDETAFTAKRVVGMLEDPIKQRYEIEEKSYAHQSSYSYGGYGDYGEWGASYENHVQEDNTHTHKSSIAAVEKRRKRCDALRLQYGFPFLCTHYPYLDYLLTDKAIIEGFHVVSTPDNKGKSLAEWGSLFDINNQDKISNLWQNTFGDMKKLYIKSSTHGMYFLAVKASSAITQIAFLGARCEREEELIIKQESTDNLKKLTEESIKICKKENNHSADNLDEDYAQMYGYCGKFGLGECSGGCHGNRKDCNCASGPVVFEGNEHFIMY